MDDNRDASTTAGPLCASCGAPLAATAKFCSECGTAATRSPKSAEYKQVTVLFADVVHSMDIAAAVGPERLLEIMTELVDRCAVVVQRFGGTVDKFTGDGIMAVFGAPAALEDHAVRACMAALGIRDEAARLATGFEDRDGIDLRVRVGLNSGQVIAGEIGSGSFGYTAVGEQVGMAQRMESVAPPGGVMLSASTARLVENLATLGDAELVRIKGADQPVAAHRLLGMTERDRAYRRAEPGLVGRRWELAAVEALLERAIDGHGAVVRTVGQPGLGKSRLVREVSAMAAHRGMEVSTAFCESHASQVPFQLVTRLLRAASGVDGLDGQEARDRVRGQITDADPEDLLLFDDLLGIGDPDVPLPTIDPDARRRRLTALVNTAAMARSTPAVYIVEDAHWIDAVSEAMLADFFTVIRQTASLALVTHRPEYDGALARIPDTQAIALAPLSDSETATLLAELLGPDPSVGAPGRKIAQRAAGNPFFAEEMVRDLAERGVLLGQPGAYVSSADDAEVSVPATLQATVAARIDRLDPSAKRTLSAAAVVGSRFSRDVLVTLGIDPLLTDLVAGQLIDQVTFAREPEYVFHHPLIRTVAYESQLKSDRAELHRRVAAAIESRGAATADEHAATIAEHLQAAGDLRAACGWHMRAGTWAATRDIAAAWVSWDRARHVADALPTGDKHRTTLRIGARTWLCGNAFRVSSDISDGLFAELRELCTLAGDKRSLTVGMVGLMSEHMRYGRVREASQLASETMTLVDAIGEPNLTVALALAAIGTKFPAGEMAEALHWSQAVIDLIGGDPATGNIVFGSPLAVTLASRGTARMALCHPGWREDYDRALAMAHGAGPLSQASVIALAYGLAIPSGVLAADDAALRDIEEAVEVTERSSEDFALGLVRSALALTLVHRESPAERRRGLAVLEQVRDMSLRGRFYRGSLATVDAYAARERARCGDPDGAIPEMQTALDDLFGSGQPFYGVAPTGDLVDTLLNRGADGDVAAAEAAIARLAAELGDDGPALCDIWFLRMHALLHAARGDDTAYRDCRDRYRAMATQRGFAGHIAWAEAMP